MPKDDYPPLVSDRSPSHERARQEHAHPAPTTDPEVIAALNRLVEAEHDAEAICLAAVDAVRDPGLRNELETMVALHQAHGRALAQVVSALGGGAPPPGGRARVLARDPGDIRYLPDDLAVLAVLAATGDEMIARYEDALARHAMPASLHCLTQNLSEERRIKARIAALVRGESRF